MKLKKEIKKHPLAYIESSILHPQFILPIILLLPFAKQSLFKEFVIAFIIVFAIPFVVFMYFFFSKRISNWDITNRKERYPIYIIALISFALGLFYTYIFTDSFIFAEFVKFASLGVIVFLINFITKISAHVLSAMVLCILLVTYFHLSILIFLAVPLVAISRIRLKRHKVIETLFAIIVPAIFYPLSDIIQKKFF